MFRNLALVLLLATLPLSAAENVSAFGPVARANISAIGPVAIANVSAIGAVDNTGGGAWTPTTPANTLLEWVKADGISLSDGDPVSTWTASAGQNATMTGGNRPSFETSVVGSLPGIFFQSATSEKMVIGSVSINMPCTAIICYEQNRAASETGSIISGDDATGRFDIDFNTTPRVYAGGADWVTLGAEAEASTRYILYIEWNAGSSFWRQNASGETTLSASPGANEPITALNLAVGNGASTRFWDGYIFEILIYDGQLGSTDKTEVLNYLGDAARWNVPVP